MTAAAEGIDMSGIEDNMGPITPQIMADEALACGCRVMGIVGAPFSGREGWALDAVRAIRKAHPDGCVRTMDLSEEKNPVPDPGCGISLLLNLELFQGDPYELIGSFLSACGPDSIVVYTACSYQGVGHFITIGDMSPSEAIDYMVANKALRLSDGVRSQDLMAAVPLNRVAVGDLTDFIRDRSFQRSATEEAVMDWRSKVGYFPLEREFRYLERYMENTGVDRSRFINTCILMYSSNMASGYSDTGLSVMDMCDVEKMCRYRLVQSVGGRYVMSAFTSEVVRRFCTEVLSDGSGDEWLERSARILHEVCSDPERPISGPMITGMMPAATRHVLSRLSNGSKEWEEYSDVIRYIRVNGVFNDPSEGCRDVLTRLVDMFESNRDSTPKMNDAADWYSDSGPLDPDDVCDWLCCKLVGVELDGPFHANLVGLRMIVDRLMGRSRKVPFVMACESRFRLRVLEDVRWEGDFGIPSQVGDRYDAGPVEALEAVSAYTDAVAESGRWGDVDIWGPLLRCGEFIKGCRCSEPVRAACLVRLYNLYSRARRKYRSYFGREYMDSNAITKLRKASEILAEAELNRILDAETLRRLEQETRIEEAKVLINSQNVFMAESQIEGVLSDPVDEIIEAAASDCFGMMRMSMKDYGEAVAYFRRAIDLYEVHLMRRKAMAGRARLMAALALGEDHVSARRMEGEMETFVRQRGDRFRYTGNLVSRFIRRIHRGPRRSCCHGSCGRMSTSSSRGPRRSTCRGQSPAPPGC